jgi:hypothetical protein
MVLDEGTVQCIALVATFLLIYRQLRVQSHANVINEYHAIHNRWNSLLLVRAQLKGIGCHV